MKNKLLNKFNYMFIYFLLLSCNTDKKYESIDMHNYNNVSSEALNIFELPKHSEDIYYYLHEGGTQDHAIFISFVNRKVNFVDVIKVISENSGSDLLESGGSSDYISEINRNFRKFDSFRKIKADDSISYHLYSSSDGMIKLYGNEKSKRYYLVFRE